jgi:hypothetical protein
MQLKNFIGPLTMMIVGLFFSVGGIISFLQGLNDHSVWFVYAVFGGIAFVISGLLLLISAIFILKRKRWAWRISIVILAIYIFINLLFIINGGAFPIIPFINSQIYLVLNLISIIFLFLTKKIFLR